MKNRKGQISSQIFVYILAAVVVGLILFVGYKGVRSVIDIFGQVDTKDFQNKLTNKVDVISNSHGTNEIFEFTLDESFDELCFVSSKNIYGTYNFDTSIIDNFHIRTAIENDVDENIFLLTEGEDVVRFKIDKMKVSGNYLCIENSGLNELWISGDGKFACLRDERDKSC